VVFGQYLSNVVASVLTTSLTDVMGGRAAGRLIRGWVTDRLPVPPARRWVGCWKETCQLSSGRSGGRTAPGDG